MENIQRTNNNRRNEHRRSSQRDQYWSTMYQLARLYKELVIKRGMSIEEVAAAVDINLNILPDMKRELDETCKALARKQVELDILRGRREKKEK